MYVWFYTNNCILLVYLFNLYILYTNKIAINDFVIRGINTSSSQYIKNIVDGAEDPK